MAQQFLRIELGLSVSGFIVFALLAVIWIIGLITIGMAIQRRWGR
jgi:hypothetical protein